MNLEDIYTAIREQIARSPLECRETMSQMLADVIDARDEVERLRAVQKSLYTAGWTAGYKAGREGQV